MEVNGGNDMQLPSPELAEINEIIVRVETATHPDPQEIHRLQQLALWMPWGCHTQAKSLDV